MIYNKQFIKMLSKILWNDVETASIAPTVKLVIRYQLFILIFIIYNFHMLFKKKLVDHN